MASILLLITLWGIGQLWVQIFFREVSWVSRVAVTVLAGTILTGWLLFVSAGLFGYSTALILVCLLGTTAALTSLTTQIHNLKKHSPKHLFAQFSLINAIHTVRIKTQTYAAQYGIVTLFILGWAAVLLQLSITHNFWPTTQGWVSGGGSYGDLALHATLAHFFAHQPQLSLENPVFATDQTTYPFLLDFLSGMFIRVGSSLQFALTISSFPNMVVLLILLWSAVRAAQGKTIALVLSTLFFLLNGGVGIVFFFQDWLKSGQPIYTFLLDQPLQYAHLADRNIHWSNIPADYFLPQRAVVLGLSLFLLLIVVFFKAWRSAQNTKRELLGIGVLIGLMPFFHVHTFLVLFPLLAWLLLWMGLTKRISWKFAACTVVLPFLVAAPQLWWQFGQTFSDGFTRLEPGWMNRSNSLVLFWLRNWGMSFVLWVFAVGVLFTRTKQFIPLKLALFPLLVLFIITNIVIFQPYAYDNMKFMLFSYLGVCLASGVLLERVVSRHRVYIVPVVLGTIILISTGLVSVIREMTLRWTMADAASIAIAEEITTKTDPTKRFLTAPDHLHPVMMLAGRKSLLGYTGWLWTHGITFAPVEKDVKTMYAGGAAAQELLQKYAVTYVFIGPVEKRTWSVNEAFFAENYPVILSTPRGTVYQVQ